ncbi:MAG: hypothetical protein HY286_06765 [Planctomycetes bacterium]|nr:hypothetical protein [Planctomycetota bacterium]
MQNILIIRDARESTRKCSIAAIQGMPNITFRGWRRDHTIALPPHVLLCPGAPPLASEDGGLPLLLVDSSWRHLPQLMRDVRGTFALRSIPAGFASAYPRKSRVFNDPDDGLATVEALFIALAVLGEWRDDILEHYHFKSEFMKINELRFNALREQATSQL